jgi:hypothetical protein
MEKAVQNSEATIGEAGAERERKERKQDWFCRTKHQRNTAEKDEPL